MKKVKLLLILSALTGTLYAQQYDNAIVKNAQTSIDITSLAKLIARQTGLPYSLNMQNASLNKKIKLKQGNLLLSDILKQVQQQAGLKYKIVGDHLIFMDDKPAPMKKKESPGRLKIEPTAVFSLKSEVLSKIQPLASAPLPDFFEVKIPMLDHFPRIDVLKLQRTLFPLQKQRIWKDKNVPRTAKRDIIPLNIEKWYQPFVKAGFSADEMVYLNASLMAGIKYIYGIISYGTSFSGARLRWGGGVSYKQLHLNFTTGTCYKADTTLHKPKERLNRLGVAWNKPFNSKWTLQLQLHYNQLSRPTDTSFRQRNYGSFNYGKVPYSFSNNNNDKKQWVGLQLSLFYKLF